MINKEFINPSFKSVSWDYIDNLVIANSDERIKEDILEYRHLSKLAQNFDIALNFPLEVSLETSFRCNLKCKTCIMSLPKEELATRGDSQIEMSFELAKKCVDEMAHYNTALVIQGTNEPLLTSWFFPLLKYTKNKINQVLFSTNGVLLDERTIDRILNSNFTLINISLDANTEATYKSVRNANVYRKVASNIKTLLEKRNKLNLKLPVISVSFVDNALNTHERMDFIKNWSKFSDVACIHSYMEPFKKDSERSLCIQHSKSIEQKKDLYCSQPWYRVVVRNNGDVLPCCSWYGMKIVMGNVNEQTIEEVWNSDKFKKIRQLHKERCFSKLEDACKECMHKSSETCDPTFFVQES